MAGIGKSTQVRYTITNITEIEMRVLYKVLAGIDLDNEESEISDELLNTIGSEVNIK